jgi:hypothetical protein
VKGGDFTEATVGSEKLRAELAGSDLRELRVALTKLPRGDPERPRCREPEAIETGSASRLAL